METAEEAFEVMLETLGRLAEGSGIPLAVILTGNITGKSVRNDPLNPIPEERIPGLIDEYRPIFYKWLADQMARKLGKSSLDEETMKMVEAVKKQRAVQPKAARRGGEETKKKAVERLAEAKKELEAQYNRDDSRIWRITKVDDIIREFLSGHGCDQRKVKTMVKETDDYHRAKRNEREAAKKNAEILGRAFPSSLYDPKR
jgi:hypothetical protein